MRADRNRRQAVQRDIAGAGCRTSRQNTLHIDALGAGPGCRIVRVVGYRFKCSVCQHPWIGIRCTGPYVLGSVDTSNGDSKSSGAQPGNTGNAWDTPEQHRRAVIRKTIESAIHDRAFLSIWTDCNAISFRNEKLLGLAWRLPQHLWMATPERRE